MLCLEALDGSLGGRTVVAGDVSLRVDIRVLCKHSLEGGHVITAGSETKWSGEGWVGGGRRYCWCSRCRWDGGGRPRAGVAGVGVVLPPVVTTLPPDEVLPPPPPVFGAGVVVTVPVGVDGVGAGGGVVTTVSDPVVKVISAGSEYAP